MRIFLRRVFSPLFLLCVLSLLPLGCGVPSFLITPVQNTNELQELPAAPGEGWAPDKIAIIEVEGMLMNAKSGGFLAPTENPVSLFTQELNEAAGDPKVKAIVLRVNSPGGTVTSSDTMYEELIAFKKKTGKPIVAATQEIAASGAYYVCCAADKIVAHPTSIVGSIGVIFQTIDVQDTMAKIGVRSEAIKSAELKDMGSPFHHLTDHEREVMQGMVNEYYARFKGVVFAHRPITDPDTRKLVTDGRVFSGVRAAELGLVDSTGQLNDAIDVARSLAGAPKARVILYKRPYGYGGSIYADSNLPPPNAESHDFNVNLPGSRAFLPAGFYYLWEP